MGPVVKALLIEDNPDTLDLLVFYFTTEGFQVICAQDGEEGLRKAFIEKPDLIFTDICMPKLDGIELITQLRKHADFQETKIVVYSTLDNKIAAQAIQIGADLVVDKLMPLDLLSQAVKELFK
jgi:two-component system, OmpR family, alkaline phosphatase synthesis response regulator PhoP